MKKKWSYTIGFDLGGTKLAAALVRSDGKIIHFTKVPVEMNREKSPLQTQKRIVQTIADIAIDFRRQFPKECSISFQGVGLASAGPLNANTGVLIHPANYPGWKKVPLLKMVEQALKKNGFHTKVHFQNDAIAAALAEGWIGGAKKMTSFAVVTVGTGIGTGVILNGRPCQTLGSGSEFGHSIVDIQTLRNSTLKISDATVEGIASGTGLLQRAKRMGFPSSSIEELINETDPKLDVLFDDMAAALAALCFNLSIGFNLDAIFFSGGLIKIKDRYFKSTQDLYRFAIQQFNPLFQCSLRVAKTKNKAGVLGAAYLPYL